MALKPYLKKNQFEIGLDEAGRGCVAGPVVAAAVLLPLGFSNDELNDSKKLSLKKRLELRELIEKEALAFAIGVVDNEEIDQINILNASILAMHRAIEQIKKPFDFLLVDGNKFKPYQEVPYQCIVKGDGLYQSIAAASILAKTYRDDLMTQYALKYPDYDWKNNKGYPTPKHIDAIIKKGYTPLHRKTFHLKATQLKLKI